MRRLPLFFVIAGLLCAGAWARQGAAVGYNSNYMEKDSDKPWEEAAFELPAYPSSDAPFVEMYVSNTYRGSPRLLTDSIHIGSDKTVRYILNLRSTGGIDNLSAESLNCKTRSVKIYGYGDDAGRRWIAPRNPQWTQVITLFRSLDPVRSVLYRTFCEDGLPKDAKELQERIDTRAVR